MMHRTTMNSATPAPAQCDHFSVGVLIQDELGRYLMFERAKAPIGVAPVAGHIDDHGDAEAAARAEVAEEVGLTVTALTEIARGWRANRCRRTPMPGREAGHYWTVYLAETTGEVVPSVYEVRNARWIDTAELQSLAERTVAYARSRITNEEFAVYPGIEPVWVAWLGRAGIVDVDDLDLAWIDLAARACSPPAATAGPVSLQRLDEAGVADLIAEGEAARIELVRTDTKAATVLAFAGTSFSVLAALVALASGLAVPARVGLGVAVALLAAAAATALCVIRPALPRPGTGTGFTAHAELGDADELLTALTVDPEMRRARDVIRLSRIARGKYRRLRLAVDLMLAALAVVVLSLPLGAL